MRLGIVVVLLGLSRLALADATCPAPPCAGNAWHVPATMRTPVRGVVGAPVVITSGNQASGPGGNPGNQLQTGSAVVYRVMGAAAWTEAPMTFSAEQGHDKLYVASLPPAEAGAEIEYYLQIAYSDHPTTFVHGDDTGSQTTLIEADARAQPFHYVIERPLAPSGAATAIAGEARVYASGHVALGDRVVIAPALVELAGVWWQLGPVESVVARGGGTEVTQRLAGAIVTTRLASAAEGVLRVEVIDWGGLAPRAIELQAASPADEHVYGLGEKFDHLDQSGKVARVLAVDAPGAKGDRSYKVVPWFWSTRGYGFHLDATAESRFDVRGTRGDRWVVQLDRGALAFHLIDGARPTDLLSRFTALAGRPPPPPPWAFAPWMSSDHWRDGGEVRYVVTRYRELGLPGSVFVFDSPWERSYNDLTWNAAQFARGGTYDGAHWDGFATPAEMLGFLGDHGFKVILWMTPFVDVASNDEGVPGQELGRATIYDEGAAAGYFVRAAPGGAPLVIDWWKGRGSPVDFTNVAARAWWQGKLAALVAESGGVIGGFKTDDGESDFIPATASYADGRRGDEMRNGYSVAYHGAVWAVLGAGGVLWSRSGYTGTQAFPGHWSGDNEPNFGAENGLASVVVAGLSAAMSGWSIWGSDIGGYQESNPSATPADLFRRWTQFAALSPIMQMHRQVGGGHQYPWSYGDDALANYRTYARLHIALFPYLYSYAHEAARTGLPILRPPVLVHPDDPALVGLDHTFYVGDWLLAAPVLTSEATTRTVQLPAGTWYDWFSGAEHAGGVALAWHADDLHRMPLFVRRGAIVPMIAEDTMTLVDVPPALEVRVWPDAAPTTFALWDGTALGATTAPDRITITLDGPARPVTLRVRSPAPLAVRRGGESLRWTREGGATIVGFEHPGGAAAIELVLSESPAAPDAGGSGDDDGGAAAGTGCACRSGEPGGLGVLVLPLLVRALWAGRRKDWSSSNQRS